MSQVLVVFFGQKGVILSVGLIFFMLTYKYSVNLFDWIEQQTYGLKEDLMQKLEFLHIEISEKAVTWGLLGFSFGSAFLIFMFFAFLGNFIAAILFGIIFLWLGWKIPKPFINYLCEKRVEHYSSQMVDGLNLLSNGLRAGLSLPQSLAMVVSELPPPISQEFNQILQQNRIGAPLDDCFVDLAKRIPTEDNDMFVTSILILRETGGNLAEIFDNVTAIIRERIRLQQKINTYTAQGMMQGSTIFAMPFAMGFIYYLSDPKSMEPLFTTAAGLIMLILALGFDLAGGYFILKIVRIKI